MYSAKHPANQHDIISQKSFKSHKSMKSHKVPATGGATGKIGAREFAAFIPHTQMGATVHNDDRHEQTKTIFSGVAGKLEVGKLQRQYSRGGKRSAHSVTKNAEQFNRVGDKSMGSIPFNDGEGQEL